MATSIGAAFDQYEANRTGDEPKKYDQYLNDPIVEGFLSGIHKHEGFPAANETVGYKKFKNDSDHPNIAVPFNSKGDVSTAAGKYQIIKSTWDAQKKKQGLKDFTEESQKRAAIGLLDESGALDAINKGDYETAVRLAGKEWAGLPGSQIGIPTGQRVKPYTPEALKDFHPRKASTGIGSAFDQAEQEIIGRKEKQIATPEPSEWDTNAPIKHQTAPTERKSNWIDWVAENIKPMALTPEEQKQGEAVIAKKAARFDTLFGVVPALTQLATYATGRGISLAAGMNDAETAAKMGDFSKEIAEKVSSPFAKSLGIDRNDPNYANEATQKIMQFVGENIEKGADYIAEKTGLPKDDAEFLLNTVGVALVHKAGGETIKAVKSTAETALEKQFSIKKGKVETTEPTSELKGVGAAKSESNPYEPFVNEEKARGGDFAVIKLSNGSRDVPLNEQQTRSEIAQKLGIEKVRTGVMTGNENQLRNEVLLAKKSADTPEGQLMKDQLSEEQRALSNFAQKRIEATGADQVLKNDYERGERVNEAFTGKDNSLNTFLKQEKQKLYDDAYKKIGNNPIEANNVDSLLNDKQFKAGLGLKGNENVANSASQLIELAKTVGFKDEFGNVYPANTIGAWDAVRKALNANWTKDNAGVIKQINSAIDKDIASAGGGDLLKKADALHQAEKVLFDSPGIKKIFGDIDPNGIQTAVPFEKIMQTLNNMPFDQWRHIYNTAEMLERGVIRVKDMELPVPQELRQAATSVIAEMKGSLAREIYEDGAKNVGIWNYNQANKTMNARSKKIEYAFDPEEIANFHTLNLGGQIMPGGHAYEGAALQTERLQGVTSRLMGATKSVIKGTAEGLPIVGHAVRAVNETAAQRNIIKQQNKAAIQREAEMKKNAQKGKTKLKNVGKE